ncbi:hypothetical protein WDW86_12875 [Bdellovibrionota bacterium FG-2]
MSHDVRGSGFAIIPFVVRCGVLGICFVLSAVSSIPTMGSGGSGSSSLMLAAFVSGSANVSVSRGSLNAVIPWGVFRGEGKGAGDFEVLRLLGSSNLQDGFFVSLRSTSGASSGPNRSPAYSIKLEGDKEGKKTKPSERTESVFMRGASRQAVKQDISIRFRGGSSSRFSDRLVVTVAAP